MKIAVWGAPGNRELPVGLEDGKVALNYNEWMEEGKRSIVKRALKEVVQKGLADPHHFYITFQTKYPGVKVPEALAALYPEEMKMVIKQAFWNLSVQEDDFFVELLFQEVKHPFTIPFKAIISFVDPAAEFGLQFIPVAPEYRSEKEGAHIISFEQFRKPRR